MSSERDFDDFDDLMKRQKRDLEAQAEWTDVVCRIADALEHFSMGQTMMQLGAMGLKTEYKGAAKHRADCPSCQAIKYAHPVKVLTPNGG